MRAMDLDRGDPEIWFYEPKRHKTKYRGGQRTVPIDGPAQAVLAPFLLESTSPESPLFRADEAYLGRRGGRPVTKAEIGRAVAAGRWGPKSQYTTNTYRQAIQRACDEAGIPRWSPVQLRKSCASMLEEEQGLEAAQLQLGHSDAITTHRHYVERESRKRMKDIAKRRAEQ